MPRYRNLAMAFYDMVPHSWITQSLDLFEVAENIKSLFVNSIESGR